MTKNSSLLKIPIIDIGPLVRDGETLKEIEKTAMEIKDACRNIGFFYVNNHGIQEDHLDTVFSNIKAFFDLPIKEKMKIHMGKSQIFRGYTPIGKELTNEKKDWNEAVDFGLDLPPEHSDVLAGEPLQGANQWPENPPEFKNLMANHWDMLINLGARITEGLALSLGLGKDYFKPFTSRSHCSMRILHYPPYEKKPEDDIGDGIGSHIDYGFLTILAHDKIGGLEVKNSAEEWISAPYIPGTFIINIGHMMQRWTNNFYKATLHRVKLQGNKDRYSLPFFFEPNFDTIVTPLEDCCDRENPPRYEPFHFGNYLVDKYSSSYAENMKEG